MATVDTQQQKTGGGLIQQTSNSQPATGGSSAPAVMPKPASSKIGNPTVTSTVAKPNVGKTPLIAGTAGGFRVNGSAPTADPAQREVQDRDTVQGQMNDIMSQDNRLNTLAREEGKRTANSRGMMNSSLAAQYSTDALIKNALPIAQQDAQTYFSQGRANQDVTNQFTKDELDYQRSMGQLEAQTNSQDYLAGNAHDRSMEVLDSQQSHDREMTELGAKLDINKMNAEQKLTLERMGVENQYQLEQLDAQTKHELEKMGVQNEYDNQRLDKELANDLTKLQEQNKLELEKLDRNLAHDLEKLDTQQAHDMEKAYLELNANYRAQYMDQATQIMQGYQQELSAVLQNPNLKSDQIANAVREIQNRHKSNMEWLAGTYQAMENYPIDFEAFTLDPAAFAPSTPATPAPDNGGSTGGGAVTPPPSNTGAVLTPATPTPSQPVTPATPTPVAPTPTPTPTPPRLPKYNTGGGSIREPNIRYNLR